MNYNEFLLFKEHTLKSQPNIINLAENNLYAYFHFENKIIENIGHIGNSIHRCHLVDDWLLYNNINTEYKKNIVVSNGVRHTLSILVDFFHQEHFIIPSDVYPFYFSLPFNSLSTYSTLDNENLFSNINEIINKNSKNFLLITYPFKPSNRVLSSDEILSLHKYLENENNSIIFDSVYIYTKEDINFLLSLFNLYPKQIYILFSLSKSFCLPNVLGLSIIPTINELKQIFVQYKKTYESLNLAFQAFRNLNDRPSIIQKKIEHNHKLVNKIINIPNFNHSYLFYLQHLSFEELLKNNILTIPSSVFGGKNGCVISTLI